MFGTLHCKSHTKEVEFIERPHGSLDSERISACDRCRAKKVRCNTNYGDCNRCKHLGETCTFSCTKHKGHKRKRKASVSVGQQESSPNFLFRSSAHWSSQDTGHEERVSSDRWPFVSSLMADTDIDDSERGRQVNAEPLTNALADSLPDFLAEFDQQTSHQDGDNVLDLSFSPSPFFSTIMPGTHPEPIQPVSAETSDSFRTPPLSSGDEIPCDLPPTRKSQGSSFFEIGSYVTLTFSCAFAVVPQAFSYQKPSGHPCQCLAAVVFAVEELEASCCSGHRSNLDSIVAYKMEAIECCRSMLKCGGCMAKRENVVLLVFMAEKIVAACGQIVVLYRMKNGNNGAISVPPSLLGCPPLDLLSHRVNVENQGLPVSASSSLSKTDSTNSSSITSMGRGTSSDLQELLGDYEINSPLEWEHVVRVLIFLQLKQVMELLADIKKTGSEVLGETQMAGLVQAEIKANKLKKDINSI